MPSIRHTGIVVNDLKRSLRFYKDILGFNIKKDMRERGAYINKLLIMKSANIRTIKLSDDKGSLIELVYYQHGPKRGRIKKIYDIGFTHLALTVDDIDKEYGRLRKKGIGFNSPPQISPDGYAKVAFCRDPDGSFIELVETLGKKQNR